MQQNQEIRCTACDVTYDLDKLDALKMYGMRCSQCKGGTCRVINLSRKYEGLLHEVTPELLLPPLAETSYFANSVEDALVVEPEAPEQPVE